VAEHVHPGFDDFWVADHSLNPFSQSLCKPGLSPFRGASTVSDGRPPDLLAQSPSACIQYFKDFTIAHPLLVEARDRLLEAINESTSSSLVIVLGPTGVGKITLLMKIRQVLAATAAADITSNQGRLPVIAIEATLPESRTFSWRSHFKRLLLERNEPLVDCMRRFNPADRTLQTMPAYPNDRGHFNRAVSEILPQVGRTNVDSS
jgi:hypothetical protein